MAVKAKSVTHGLSHRSILNLDKSDEPFSIQIAEACDILSINLKEPSSYLLSEVEQQHDTSSYGPQEEWALRWLLKNLQSADLQPARNLSLYPKAWLLLRELIVRTPLTNAARLLSAHKFTASLQKIFKWIRGQTDHGTGQTNFPLSWDPAASSSETIEASTRTRLTKSRKRKRDDQQSGPLQKSIEDLGFLFASICSTIEKLQAIIKGPTGPRDFVVEHLKSAMRSSPEQAADILGSSMVLASLIFDDEHQPTRKLGDSASSEDSDKQNQSIREVSVYEACIACMVEIWNSCSATAEDSSSRSEHLVFSVHCMVPTLRFIGIYRVVPHSSSKKEEISKALEQLLVNNVVLPARTSYFAAKNWKKTDIEAESSLSVEALLAPLAKVSKVSIEDTSVRDAQNLSIPAIPLLFSVAVQSLPRNTPRQRSLDDPWLQYLFGQLRNISFSSTMLQHKHHISNLNWMLREALSRKVRLDSTTLEAILAQVMNIANEDFTSPDAPTCWTLINLCLQIDANVFISSSSADRSRNDVPSPNRYLDFLFLQLSSGSWKSSPQSDPNYNAKMLKVIQPLAKAYTNTRDLTTFISHWREQIILCKQQRMTLAVDVPPYCNSGTIWEDEELILLVGRMAESSLTSAQISGLLRKISAKLPLTHAVIQCDASLTADLIILESIISGLSRESNLDHLTGDAQSVYLSISSIISGNPDWAGDDSWRLWRILSIFNERWSLPRHSEAAEQAERLLMTKAADSVSYAIRAGTAGVERNFTTELHAFSFMLKEVSVRSGESDLKTHHISSSIQAILNSRRPACDHMRLNVDWSRTPPEFSATWNAQNDTINSVDILVIGCIAQILTSPAILRDLDTDMQRSFFSQLQLGALAFKHSGQATEFGDINYLSLWELLLESEFLKESAALTRIFRDVQASFYLEVSSAQVFDIKQYEIAFLSIQRTPVRAFERDKRNRISRRILQVLLGKSLPTFTLLEDHIALLTGYLSTSHRFQNLLISTKGNEIFEGEPTGTPIDRAPLISLAQKLDSEMETEISRLVAFRRFVYYFFRHCAPELAQDGKMEYFAAFYDQLAKLGSGSDMPYHLSYAFSILFERSLEFYLNHLSGSSESMRNKRNYFEDLRHSQSEKVRTEFYKIHETKTLIDRSKLSIVLEGMFSYSDILSIESSGREKALLQLSEIAEQLCRSTAAEGSADAEGEEFIGPDQLLVQITRVAACLRADRQNPHQAVLETKKPIQKLKSSGERRKLLHHLRDMIAKHKKRDVNLLKTLGDSEANDSFTAEYLLLLQQVILAGHKDSRHETADEYAIELDRTYSGLCDQLILPSGYRLCMLKIQCLNLLLQKEPRIISQWHIDNTLAAIAILSSRLEQTIRAADSMSRRPGLIFTGLCRIFSSMLISHRPKLGGRYHLILPPLQGLLRCLYSPYPSLSNSSTPKPTSSSSSSSAPSPSISKRSIISLSHASLYSRLLTTLCSPTVSAVTPRHRSFSFSSLNDETKKARSIAGQHLQYLIMEYCTCQLWGRLTTTTVTTSTTTIAGGDDDDDDDDDGNNKKGGMIMREKLMPGIFAVMDVMSAEVKRTVNARLDASGRSIFKGLYEEWRKEGRWKGG